MSCLVVSDIHGALPPLQRVLCYFDSHRYDLLLLLGDLLNYGPRNGLPDGLDAMGVAETLNRYADRIVAIRGNCDSEVDQMLLHFPCMADYSVLTIGNKRLLLTHGHVYNPDHVPPMSIDAIFCGHTHLWRLERNANGLLVCNTGSITFPKNGNEPTFATISDNGTVQVRHLNGSVLKEVEI